MKHLAYKLVKTGDVAEFREYRWIQVISPKGEDVVSAQSEEIRRIDSLARTRQSIYYLTRSNVGAWGKYPPVFLTLTYARNEKNLSNANEDFRLFMKLLSREVNKKLRYVAVPEFQKRGAVHYHILFFNLPKLKPARVQELWGNGSIRIEKVKGIKNMAAYFAKYLTKDTVDKRMKGFRILKCSRGLVRPQVYYNDDALRVRDTMTDTGYYIKLPNVTIKQYETTRI